MDKDREKAKESLKYMSGKEKVFHFIRYYKMPILVVSILIVISISLIGNFTFNKRPEGCLQIGVRAGVLDPDAIEALPGHLTEKYPDMTEGGEKAFYAEQFYAGYKDYEAEEALVVSNRLDAFVASGMVDVLIGDLETLQNEVGRGVFLDLREAFTEEELEQIEKLAQPRTGSSETPGIVHIDYKVAGTYGRTESIIKDITYLICISEGDEYIDSCISHSKVYLAIIWNTENMDNVKTFIWSLLGENVD